MPEQMTPDEFGAKIKAKYPAYANLSNIEIANKVVAKYPQYKDSIKAPTETPITPPSLYEQFSKPVSAIGHAAHPIQANLADVGRGAINAVGTFVQHPRQTLSASSQMLGDLLTVAFPNGQPDEKLTASRGRLREQLSAAKEHPAFTVGQLAAGELGGEVLTRGAGKVMDTVPKVGETLRKGAQSMIGAGERPVKAAVAKEAESANTAREDVLKKNKRADESTLLDRGKVDEANAKLEETNASATSNAEKVNAQLVRRSAAQKELAATSSEMDVAVEKARHDALDVGNKQFSAVNKKLNPLPADMEKIQDAHGEAANAIGEAGAQPVILNRLGKSIEHGEQLSYSDLQALYSELGKELSKGTLNGRVYHAYDILHDAIGEDMQRLADSQGMGQQLTDARAYWKRMKQTFGKSSDTINNRASKAVRSADPNLPKSQASAYQLRLLSSFDPNIETLATKAAGLRQELSSLPKTASEVTPGVHQEYSEPHATTPTERPVVSPRAIREGLLDRWTSSESVANKWQIRALVTGTLGTAIGLVLGEGRIGAEMGGVAGAVFGPAVVAKILEQPAVREWMTRPPARELEALRKLPNADKIKITGDLMPIIQGAQKQGIKVSPALLGAVMGSRNYPLGPNTKRLKAKSDELRNSYSANQ